MTPENPVAIVTGGARRVGRAIVEDLAAHGWSVVIHTNRSRAEGEALAAEIAARGGRAAVVVAELTDPGAAGDIMAAANDAFGPVNLLVNSAAVFATDAIGSLDQAAWTRQMTINLTAPVFLAEAFAAQLPRDDEGSIVNIIDQRVLRPIPRYFGYQASKAGLWTMTQALAQALAPRIRVNAIAPGPILKSTRQEDHDFRRQVDAILTRRVIDLGDFGRTVRFLVETRSITGEMIALDGGQHLAWETPDVAEVAE